MMTYINKTMSITFILEEIQDRLDYSPDLIIFHTVKFTLKFIPMKLQNIWKSGNLFFFFFKIH